LSRQEFKPKAKRQTQPVLLAKGKVSVSRWNYIISSIK